MSVDVVWHTYEPNTLARGYWDQALLEDLFSHSLWRPPGAHDFDHHEGTWPDAPGVVAVIPGRHNAAHAAQLNADTARYDWVLYVFTGDEAAEFPWPALTHPNRRVWAMGARPDRCGGVDVPLGSGYPTGTREYLASLPATVAPEQRRWDWAFVGQITHQRRQEMRTVLNQARKVHPGKLVETKEFAANLAGKGLAQSAYLDTLRNAKVIPCPSGPVAQDSFRFYEALECLCIPAADAAAPGYAMPEYWTYLFGQNPPFPLVYNWDGFPGVLFGYTGDWLAHANPIAAWWTQTKRNLAWRLHNDVTGLCGLTRLTGAQDVITVVIPTSPSPTNPDLEIINTTIESVRWHLPDAEVVVVCDPPRPELAWRTPAWEAYVHRLCWAAHHTWHNVTVVTPPAWGHQANAVRAAMELVRTDHVLIVEYDTPMMDRPIDWGACVATLDAGLANMIRFYHDGPGVHPSHEHLMVGGVEEVCGIPLQRTIQFSARPHLAPAWWYRDILDRYFPPDDRTFIEDRLHGIVQTHGARGWPQWRIWIYSDPAPYGNIQRSYHLDGRRGDPKYECTVAK